MTATSRTARSTRRQGRGLPRRPVGALMLARLAHPNPGPFVLERRRLFQSLADHADRPLTLVVAEAGYGKTSLLAGYTRTRHQPVVWYSLMPSDADLVVFVRHLLEGLRRAIPRFGRATARAVDDARPGGRTAETLAGTLLHELSRVRGPCTLLVLDDFQEVAGQAPVVTFCETLLRHLPPSLRVIIASRTAPPLPIERMRSRGELFEIHSGHLRLTHEELAQLFAEVYRKPLEESEVAALEETTLGWPTAVHLVHESLERSGHTSLPEVLQDFRGSHLELHDYLSAEVYARLDEPTRRLLERTAALNRFDAGVAAQLADRYDAGPTLAALTRRGLLRTFGSGDSASYQCHDLVRRFLRHEIEARGGPQAWKALEAETGAVLLERGHTETALRHYLQADCVPEAAALLRELGPLLLRQGRAVALRQYLGEMPAAALREDAELTLAMADTLQATGSWDEAEIHYQAVLERCRAAVPLAGGADAVTLECRALIGLGKVLNLRGRYEQVLGMAERGLAAGPEELEIVVRLMQMKAGAHFYLGQYRAAVAVLDEVRARLDGRTDVELLVPTIHNLAVAYASQGRLHEASREFRFALAQVRGADSPRAALYLPNLALVLADLGELVEARRAAEEGLVAAQRFSNRAQECMCHEALALTLAESGDLDGALAALRSAEQLNEDLRIEVIAADLLVLRGRIFCARGEYRRGAEFLTQAIERSSARADNPTLPDFQALLAWCELRAGRVRVARDLLLPLARRADAGENDARRMRAHYWLGEALLASGGRREAGRHLAIALQLVRERSYQYFLRVQAREEPAPLLEALARGIEVDTVAAALVEAGGAIEPVLLSILERAPTPVGEAAIAVLAEVGGRASQDRLERLASARRPLATACRTALRHVRQRLARGVTPAASPGEAPRLLLFGPPRLEVDGRAVPPAAWRAQRALQLLAFLALHPRGATRDELLERFWPGRQAAAGRRNFHPTLSYVRHVLPSAAVPAILREAEVYRLHPAYPLSCDAWEFERRLEEARGGNDPGGRRAALSAAVELSAAPLLQGWYAGWADELQGRFRDRLEKTLLELGHLYARAGEFEAALDAFHRAAALDAFRESTQLAAIECLIRLGNRRAALAEYEKLKTTLRRELGVEPLPETADGMQRLLADRPVHDWPRARQSEPPESPESAANIAVTASSQVPDKSRRRRLRT